MATPKRSGQGFKLPKGIRLTSNGKFKVEPCVKGKRESATCDTVEEALAAHARLVKKLQDEWQGDKHHIDSGTWTLHEAYDWTFTLRWQAQKADIHHTYRSLEKYFGAETPLTQITTEKVDQFVKDMIAQGNSDATINRKLSCLSTIMDTALSRGKLERKPVLQRRKEFEGRIRYLSNEEEEAVIRWFRHFGKEDHAEITIVLVDTGFRVGELWTVCKSSINFVNRTISLWETKADTPRTIPMTGRVFEIIQRRSELYPEGPLFPGADKHWFLRQWNRVKAKMGLADDEQFVPHALRHTCCSRLVQRGVPLLHVQKWMGHRTIQTTMRYAHLAPHDLFSLVQVLDGGNDVRWTEVTIPQEAENSVDRS